MKPAGRVWLASAAFLLAGAAVLAGQSGDPESLVREGRKLNGEGKQAEAIALYRKALAANPNLFDAQLQLGIALDLNGEYAEAQRHFTKAIELATPQAKTQALKSMAMSYAFERNCQGASKFEQQVFDSQMQAGDFAGAAGTADELARICLESGDANTAYRWYRTGHETGLKKPGITPAERDLWDFRWEHAQARIAARRGNRAEAQQHESAAKAILDKGTNPEQARFYPYLAGYVAFYGGDYKAAIAQLQQADQRDPFILALIAQAYEKAGDKAQAMEYYRKALAFNIHNPTNAFARPLARRKAG